MSAAGRGEAPRALGVDSADGEHRDPGAAHRFRDGGFTETFGVTLRRGGAAGAEPYGVRARAFGGAELVEVVGTDSEDPVGAEQCARARGRQVVLTDVGARRAEGDREVDVVVDDQRDARL